jgi:hypothetical protein
MSAHAAGARDYWSARRERISQELAAHRRAERQQARADYIERLAQSLARQSGLSIERARAHVRSVAILPRKCDEEVY